jgi:hypothetical protein
MNLRSHIYTCASPFLGARLLRSIRWRAIPLGLGRAAVPRFRGVSGLLCHVVSRSPPGGQTALAYHIVRVVVQHSKTGRP